MFQNYLIGQSCQMIHPVFSAQVFHDSGKEHRLSLLIPFQMPAAAQPDPFAPAVSGAELHAVGIRASIRYLLIRFQESLAVMLMYPFAPHCCGVLQHLTRQVKLLHHAFRVPEHACFHIAEIDIILCAFYQCVIEEALVILEVGCSHFFRGLHLRRPFFCPLDMPFALLHIHSGISLVKGRLKSYVFIRAKLEYPIGKPGKQLCRFAAPGSPLLRQPLSLLHPF